MEKKVILTDLAPAPIGPYSQAIQVNEVVYLSGQIPLDPQTQTLVSGDIIAETTQVFNNLQAVCKAAGGDLNNIVKLTVYLTDLSHFSTVNDIISSLFEAPYPARTLFQAAALPKAARVEVDAVMVL